jgi:methylmalonyl-CoA carboxyltransferase 5S subunit
MFPKVAPKFFTTRAEGPKNVGKDPSKEPAAAAPAPAKAVPENGSAKGPVRTTVTYDVKLNGLTHKVTVAPAK